MSDRGDVEQRPFQVMTLNGQVVLGMAEFTVGRLLKRLGDCDGDPLLFSLAKQLKRARYFARGQQAGYGGDDDDGSRRPVDDGRFTDSENDVDFGDDEGEQQPYGQRMRKTGS